MKIHKLEKGFTLIELLVVVAIIGMLAAIVGVSVRGAQSKSRDSKRKTEIGDIKKALESFRLDKGRYVLCDTPSQTGYQCGFGDGAGGVIGSVWNTNDRGINSTDLVTMKTLINPMPKDPKIDRYYTYATYDASTTTDGYYGSYAFAVALENSTGLTYTDQKTVPGGAKYYKCRAGENFVSIGFFSTWFNHPEGSGNPLGQPCNF
jgi:prepilin-type N-terminal cleavage/methylation domain-containing protein